MATSTLLQPYWLHSATLVGEGIMTSVCVMLRLIACRRRWYRVRLVLSLSGAALVVGATAAGPRRFGALVLRGSDGRQGGGGIALYRAVGGACVVTKARARAHVGKLAEGERASSREATPGVGAKSIRDSVCMTDR
jgi:hypothetical protein